MFWTVIGPGISDPVEMLVSGKISRAQGPKE